MNTLIKTIGIWLVSLPLIAGCPGQEKSIPEQTPYVKLQGTVFSERYMPTSGSSFNAPDIQSRYSFSMDTKLGRKAVQVESTIEVNLHTASCVASR